MLSPALLRLCFLAVMAPALTKAVRQADGFTFMLMSHENGDLLPSKVELPLANDRSEADNHLGEYLTNNCCGLSNGTHMSNGELWHGETFNGNKLKKTALNVALNDPKNVPDGPKTNNVNGHSYQNSVGVPAPTFQNCDLNSTMNEASSDNQERMGLLNANTSLDCDFQSKNSVCQYSSPICSEDVSALEPETLEDIPTKCPAISLLSPPGSPKSASGESTSTVTAHNPPVVTFAELEEVKNLHKKCTTRTKDLLLRLRKLQVLQVDKHVTGQIKSLFSHYQNVLSIPCQKQLKQNATRRTKDTVDLKAEFLQNEDVRNLSTAALVNLVRKLESSNSSSGNPVSNRSSLSQAEDSFSNEKVNTRLSSRDSSQAKQVTGSLLMRVKHLESAIDSDATESSSGGESCDEYEGYDDKKANSTPVHKRALWTWVFERAPIAKRWTWLQSQVQDLEYRVRQIADLLAQARGAKGMASFEDVNTENASVSPSSEHSPAVKKVLRSVNGFVDHSIVTNNGFNTVPNVPPSPEVCLDSHEKSLADECAAAVSRTRPFKSVLFRKRKLLYTTGLHYVSRKAARLSTVKCTCNSRNDVLPCILCCGRYNNTQSVDPNVMPLLERVALLEPSFHPVLSFEKDIPLSLHFESHLRKNEMYYRVAKPVPVAIKKSHLGIKSRGLIDRARHHSRKLTRHAAQTLLTSARYRTNKSSSKLRNRGLVFARWKGLQKSSSFKRKHFQRWSAVSSCSSSRQGSPVHSPATLDEGFLSSLSGREHYDNRRRRDGHQFDIDNIVIPYNIKTASSFQKLQYKEIVTPKWRYYRETEQDPIENEESEEDISDETIIKRHDKLEIAERKIIRGGVVNNVNSTRRSRKNFRHDSRADSSGANTPDHLSMYHQDIMFQDSNSFISGGPSSPALSPPATPGSVNTISDDSQPSCSNVPAPCTERRRTVSLTKQSRYTDDTAHAPVRESKVHPPFEDRVFPLCDEVWESMLREPATSESLPDELEAEEPPLREPSSPESPDTSSSTSSALEDDDEMADPEWTVVRKQNGPDRTLVIKLAKR